MHRPIYMYNSSGSCAETYNVGHISFLTNLAMRLKSMEYSTGAQPLEWEVLFNPLYDSMHAHAVPT